VLTRLVVDTDPGVDDALALMLAFAHPGVRIDAVTVVAGNVGLDRTVANACTILDVLGADPVATPVHRGCSRPLLSPRVVATSHGADGLGDCRFPPSSRALEAEHASLALVRLGRETPGACALVALGPLTNVALAMSLDPELPAKYRRLIVMGGAVRATGNMPNPSTEFNASSDPEAAAIVLGRWPDVVLVPWETAMHSIVSMDRVRELWAVPGARAEFARRITAQRPSRAHQHFGVSGMFVPDPVAMAVAVDPTIVTRSEHRHVIVELEGRHTRGQTTVDWFGFGGGPPTVEVVLEVDGERFWRMLRAAVG
jgi:purine nucleosidase